MREFVQCERRLPGVAFFSEAFLRTCVERLCFGPIEEPSKPVCLGGNLTLWKRPGLTWRTEESANVFERKLVVDGEKGQLKTR